MLQLLMMIAMLLMDDDDAAADDDDGYCGCMEQPPLKAALLLRLQRAPDLVVPLHRPSEIAAAGAAAAGCCCWPLLLMLLLLAADVAGCLCCGC